MRKIRNISLLAVITIFVLTSCEKVSPVGVLIAGTGVEDRVKMSHLYYKEHKGEYKGHVVPNDEYTFLVGADSHMTNDAGRMEEMLQNGLDHDDVLYAHLGDIADTKAEYYINLENVLDDYKLKYAKKNFDMLYLGDVNNEAQLEDYENYYVFIDKNNPDLYYSLDQIPYPFYPVVGNHDITHNGWALWSNIFHSSFYDVYVLVGGEDSSIYDHFIFLDTANGTLGREQINLIEEGVLDDKYFQEFGFYCRHTFVFSHTNIFRPSSLQFSSTFAREETFFLLDQFVEWKADIVFCGHVHKWDEHEVGGVQYITLDTMSESNKPEPGDYLLRVHVKKDGTLTWERVHMNYTPKKKK
ncbi:MAG: metallophosphoesterase [Prevotella sp.]|nr:metallophosphoesterase [Prevotella sp.]